MNPEREIIDLWLGKRGFFTLNSIPLENNKIIDILGIKIENGKLDKIVHIETACSISTLDNIPMKVYVDKFDDRNVIKKVRETIKEFIGTDAGYEKILVIGNTARFGEFQKLEGIKIVKFEDVLYDVMLDLNKQSYRNEITRTLQLVKFLLMSKPDKLAEVAGSQEGNNYLTHKEREDFLRSLLNQEDVRMILGKKSMEQEIASILGGSTLSQPEKLAEAIEGRLMTSRGRKKFERLILQKQEALKPKKEEPKPKEKSLELFFSN